MKPRHPPGMKIHYGLVASGDKVIKDPIFRTESKKVLGDSLLCIEMEAAGMMNDFPCVTIRGICDYADSHKNKIWQEPAAAVAAAYAKELLMYLAPTEVKREESVGEYLQRESSLFLCG